jgi:hypothetical protein
MKKLITIMALAIVGISFAQEEEQPSFDVSGSIDSYFRANLTAPNVGATGDYSAFSNDAGFSLGLANVTLSYEGEKVGFVADLAVGQRADQYNGNGSIVNEAYMYWNVSDKVALQMGRFNSWMGYEELSAANNFHYSMSHMFTYSARNFNGLVARFDLGNDFGLGLGLMNPVNVIDGNQNDSGAYSVAAGIWKGKTGLSFAASQETSYIDFKTAFDVSETFNVAINAHIADYKETPDSYQPGDGFTSISAYPQMKSSEALTWGMRLEYMMFDNFVNDVSVFSPTLTANYTVGALSIKPELRIDAASEDIFIDNDSAAAAGLTSFVLGAVYSF